MTVKELLDMLSEFPEGANVDVYDDDNDRTLDISCIAEDEADESETPRVLIFV